MDQELCESEVMWAENDIQTIFRPRRASEGRHGGTSSGESSSARPVKIPISRRRCGGGVEEEEVASASIVPPHMVISRRRTHEEVAFSLCSGHGRTLKGRDLSYLRNSVLRMTGFIES